MKKTMYNKAYLLIFVPIMLLALNFTSLACKVTFNIVDNNGKVLSRDSKYKKGDEFILEIIHKVTHRNCDTPIEDTKLVERGLKVISATKWKSEGKNTSLRKLKLKVTDVKSGKVTLSINRNCNRGEQIASFSIEVSK